MNLFKKFSLAIACLATSFSFAQTIQFSQVNNLDMMIANIFGVQCDGVSNVQLLAVPIQVGRFENGGILGLNSGLVLSTGVVSGSQQPSGAFNSTGFGTSGDADIAQFGANAGQFPTNYDACVVEFDFTPTLSDTIRFTYVLASEEYPEYANTSFTDRFLFLVSENSGAYANIAFLPGTTTPVEINSVNQMINPQYYIDNLSGPNAGSFIFDAYTTPFEAKFFAQTGSTYHIKLVIADVSDNVFDSAIFLDEQESFNDIDGMLTVNGSPAEGILEVFNFVGDTLLAQPVQTLTVSNGTYLADSLQTGMYHVRFTPDPVLFPGVAPLYYTNGDTWSTADAIGLPCFLNSGNINSNTLNVLSGSGVIAGNVIIDTTYLKSPTVGFENALVKLFNATNQVVAFTYTDATGNFQFTSIPSGNYYIRLDVPYIPQLNEHAITVIGNEVVIGADFSVLLDGIYAIDNLALGIEEATLQNVAMYPNPAKEKVTITNGSNAAVSYELITIDGQLIQSGTIGVGTTDLSLEAIAEGIYFVRLGSTDLRKLIIKK
jgi:Secretion system C-terminal sorting domain